MIKKLFPKDIAIFWDSIKHGYIQANPMLKGMDPYEYSNNLLFSLLTDRFQCWVVYDRRDGDEIVLGFLITTIRHIALLKQNYVHVIALYGFRKFPDAVIDNMFEGLQTFADNNGCIGIKTDTTNKRVHQIMERLGFTKGQTTYYYRMGDLA